MELLLTWRNRVVPVHEVCSIIHIIDDVYSLQLSTILMLDLLLMMLMRLFCHLDLNTVAEVKAFIEDDEHSVIGEANIFMIYFENIYFEGFFTSENSELKVAFSAVSNTLRESFRFAHSDDKEVLDEYGFQEE